MASSRMATLDSEIFKCCHKVTTLGWSNDTEAKRLLQDAADQVKPIMARRKWAVPLLNEFYPSAPNLLGLNQGHGQKIFIRLRSPSNRDMFLSYESILGTLLHELVHIEVGPHNQKFYALLDELQNECDELIVKGNDGKSGKASGTFEGQGNKLGGWGTTNVPRHLVPQRAAQAAQRRQRIASIMSHGTGGRLGGGTAEIARICDPREMALAAAERRRLDDERCASHRENFIVSDAEVPPTTIIDVDAEETSQQKSTDIEDIIVISDDDDNHKASNEEKTTQLRNISRNTNTIHRNANTMKKVVNVPTRQTAAARAAMEREQRRRRT